MKAIPYSGKTAGFVDTCTFCERYFSIIIENPVTFNTITRKEIVITCPYCSQPIKYFVYLDLQPQRYL